MTEKEQQMPQLYFADSQSLKAWLAAYGQQSGAVWLVLHKKNNPVPSVSYSEVVDAGLCYGWIDSKPNKLDEGRYLLLFTPRKKGSVWSAVNKARIEKLLASGAMTPAGLAKIEAAQADGSWTAIDSVEALDLPEDLSQALSEANLQPSFDYLAPSTRKPLLQWLLQAKTLPTRLRRIAAILEASRTGISPLAYRKKADGLS